MKAFLLDTHALLWTLEGDKRLRPSARTLLLNAEKRYVSMASLWEISIKASLGNLRPLPDQFDALLVMRGFTLLPIALPHVMRVQHLPFHHRDPFDRLLIAQAMSEGVPILTADPEFAAYDVALLPA